MELLIIRLCGKITLYLTIKNSFILNNPIKISPGDSLKTYCEYDTSNSDKPVIGGEASNEEMCATFLQFYPREKGPFRCVGMIPPSIGCQFFYPYNRTDNSVLNNSETNFARRNNTFVLLYIILLMLF